MADNIQGLYYVDNYIPDPDVLLEQLLAIAVFEPITSSSNSRRVSHYGYRYKYDRSGVTVTAPIPELLMDLTEGIENAVFNQVIVNEYKKSQMISPHIDHTTLFGPVIAGISLGTTCDMVFTRNSQKVTIPLKVGSLYVLTGDARYKWKHSLRNTSPVTRYSITFRQVIV